jgi:predicted MPP superfamily phosphohydrolase
MPYWIAIFASYLVFENVAFAALQIWLLRRRTSWPKWLGIAVCAWAALMIGLFVIQVFEPVAWKPFLRHWLYFPLAVEMVWNLLFLQVLFPAMILMVLLVRRFRPVSHSEPLSAEGMSRRKFLYLATYGAAPAVALGMGVHGGLTRHDLRVRKFQIPIANLPPELEGFTLAHVSDLHSGIFVGPSRLKIATDATNDLKPDMVAITGDLINREMNELPAALSAMKAIKSPYGSFLCEGNHDVIPGPKVVARACAQNQFPMLFNTCSAVPVRGKRLLLGGLFWDAVYLYKSHPEIVANLFPVRQEGDVRILLAHHPHLFDVADSTDLVLSGHTHGGQIMATENFGLGNLRFKYCSGLFHRGNTTLIVNNGCGDWFPCRIGAPAEIGLLTLTAAKPTA